MKEPEYDIDTEGFVYYKGVAIGLKVEDLADMKAITGIDTKAALEYFYSREIQKNRERKIDEIIKGKQDGV